MYKKLLATSLVAASVLFVGCGSSDSTCRIDVQKALDSGDFNTAISMLDGECAATFSQSDKDLNLAAAYMGKSGFGVSEAVKIALDADNNGNNTFSTFMASVDKNRNANTTKYLNRAQNYFIKALDKTGTSTVKQLCDNVDKNNSRAVNICLYMGFNDTIQTTATITTMTKDINKTIEAINTSSSGTTPLDMKASTDALAWAVGNTLPNASTITPSAVTIGGVTYAHLNVLQSGKTFYRLAKSMTISPTNSTVVTDGYTAADGDTTTNCTSIEDNATGEITNTGLPCYAAPVVLDDNSSANIANLIVDTLNGGTDTIVGITNDADLNASISKFKKDITGGVDRNITIDDIIKYLNGN